MHSLKKVLLWRACSVLITIIVTWIWTGDIKAATGLTAVLHLVLVIAHWIFEESWERWVLRQLIEGKLNPVNRSDKQKLE